MTKIISSTNEVNVFGWDVNTGEYKAKKCKVETPNEFAECNAIMVSFNSKENGKFVSWVKDGECDLPCFTNPGTVSVGVYAYIETEGKLELRFSPSPVVLPINEGSYIEGEAPPTPTPGTYADLLEKIAGLEKSAPSRIAYVTLLSSAWEGEENLYSQVVNVDGATKNSQVDLTPSVEQLAIFYNKDLAFVTENENGVVTVYAIGQKPQNDYTIQVTLTEVRR